MFLVLHTKRIVIGREVRCSNIGTRCKARTAVAKVVFQIILIMVVATAAHDPPFAMVDQLDGTVLIFNPINVLTLLAMDTVDALKLPAQRIVGVRYSTSCCRHRLWQI